MNRRNFLGVAVGAAVAGPEAVKSAASNAAFPPIGGYSLSSSVPTVTLGQLESQLEALTRKPPKDYAAIEYSTYDHLKSFSPAAKRLLMAQDNAERDYWRQHSWLTQQIAELTGFKQP